MKTTSIIEKFAVRHTVGNEVTIIRLFDAAQKKEAETFARKIASNHDTGIIFVISAFFIDGAMERADGWVKLYEVYPCQSRRS